jgi:hypothetical protein
MSNLNQMKRDLSFMDASWLQSFGLSQENVLDYFYLSPFYDSTANNQILRAQRVSPSHLLNMIGLEFIVEPNPYEPTLFLIKKQNRKSSHHVEVLEVFYVMEGIIYQSPSLIDVLSTRYNKIALYLHQAFEIALNDSKHSSGHTCLDHPSAAKPPPTSYVKIREFPSINSTIQDLDDIYNSISQLDRAS